MSETAPFRGPFGIAVDPARADGPHLVVDLPAGVLLLPGDVATVTDPAGRVGTARVACVNFATKRLYLGVTWPQPLPRRVPGRTLTAAVVAAGGAAHPADIAGQLAAEYDAFRRTALGETDPTPMETADV